MKVARRGSRNLKTRTFVTCIKNGRVILVSKWNRFVLSSSQEYSTIVERGQPTEC